jgi:probable HAF family extracellular repeat protein
MTRTRTLTLGLIAALTTAVAHAAPPLYRIKLLPAPVYAAYDINNLAQVAGVASIDGREAAVLWSEREGMLDIGAIGNFVASRATAVSEDGLVAGFGSAAPTPPFDRGFLYDAARGVVLTPGLPGGAAYGFPAGVASGGRATGSAAGHAVIWTWAATLEVMDLGDLPGGSVATMGHAINTSGHVAGYGSSSEGNRAFLWTPASGFVNLGVLPGFTFASIANDINDADAVVGSVQASPSLTHGFLWTAADGMRDLGELPGGQEFADARAINERNQVVGYSTTAAPLGANPGRAVLWQNSAIYDLNQLIDPADPLAGTVLLTQANGINDRGQIVGIGTSVIEERGVAFLLSPVDRIADQLAELLESVTGVGPGRSLADKLTLAQTYYAVPDIQATCSILGAFDNEVLAQRGKKLTDGQAEDFLVQSAAIMSALGCP